MRASPLGMRLFALAKAVGGFGPNIVVNGDFSVNSSWNIPGTGSITGGQYVGNSSGGFLWQSNASVLAGHTYRVTFTISSYTSGNATPYLGSGETDGTLRASNGTFVENITPATGGELGFKLSSPNLNIDDFKVEEVL